MLAKLKDFRDTIGVVTALIVAFITFDTSIVWSKDYLKDKAELTKALNITNKTIKLNEVRDDIEDLLKDYPEGLRPEYIVKRIERLEREEKQLEAIVNGS